MCGVAVACVALAAQPARAAEAVFDFHIARKPLAIALVDFALQSGVSVSTGQAKGCAALGGPLAGRYTVRAGLERLLEGTGCGARMIDSNAWEIVRLPPAAPAPPPAPEPKPAPPRQMSELVVTATRRPTRANRLAYPVSALGRDALGREGIADAGDLALATPSMAVTNLGPGRDKIMLRGLSDGPLTGRTQSMVGIYLDEVRVTYNAPDPDLRLVDMAQVEVLRGPQGALYGAGSLGGVLHLVTAEPDPSRRSGWISVGGGATHDGAASSDAAGMVNLPLLGGRAALRAVIYRDVQGGYLDDAALGLTDVNRTRREGLRLAARMELSDRWTLTARTANQAINSDDTQYTPRDAPALTRANALREPHDNDFIETSFDLKGDLDIGRLDATVAMIRHNLASRYDATAAPPVPAPAGPLAFDETDEIHTLVAEATLTSPSTARIRWLAGGFFSSTRQSLDQDLIAPADPAVAYFSETRRDRLTEAALFGEATAPVAPKVSLTLGGRVFYSQNHVTSDIAEPAAAWTSRFSDHLSHVGFAPKLVVAYTPSPRTLFYVQAAEGYRAAGFNTTATMSESLASESGASGPWRRYGADELWSFETGARLELFDDRLALRLAAFEARWTNIQSDQLLASGLPYTANLGDGRNRGLEAEGAWRDGALELRGEFLVNAPELEKPAAGFSSTTDLSLAAVPEISGGASAHYAWALPGGFDLAVDGRLAYVGKSWLAFDPQNPVKMGDYATTRLAATLSAARWRFTLAVDNAANARGDTFAYGNPFIVRTTPLTTPLRPRTAMATLRVDF